MSVRITAGPRCHKTYVTSWSNLFFCTDELKAIKTYAFCNRLPDCGWVVIKFKTFLQDMLILLTSSKFKRETMATSGEGSNHLASFGDRFCYIALVNPAPYSRFIMVTTIRAFFIGQVKSLLLSLFLSKLYRQTSGD